MFPVIHEFDLFGWLKDPFALHTYGVLIATGFVLAMQLAKRQAAKEGEDPERVIDLAFYVLLTGLIGSRIVFIITKYDVYIENPIEVLMFWRGGLVWYGGFITAAAYVLYYCRKHRLNYFKIADLFIPVVALAHAFGRLGCLAAGCCFGEPTDSFVGITFPPGSMAHSAHYHEGYINYGDNSAPVHPTQLYESGFEFAMFWALMIMRRYKRFHGQLFLSWLVVYPIARSIIEMYRGDKERGVWALGMSTSQYISIAVAGFSIWLFFYLRRQNATPATEPEPAADAA